MINKSETCNFNIYVLFNLHLYVLFQCQTLVSVSMHQVS